MTHPTGETEMYKGFCSEAELALYEDTTPDDTLLLTHPENMEKYRAILDKEELDLLEELENL